MTRTTRPCGLGGSWGCGWTEAIHVSHKNRHRCHNVAGNVKRRRDVYELMRSERRMADRSSRLRRKWRRERMERRRRIEEEYGMAAWKKCTSKNRYDSEGEARSYARTYSALYGIHTDVYRCDLCGGWHLTTHPRGGMG